MPSTPQGDRLAGEFRAAQLAVQAAALREVAGLWSALDPARLRETAPAWLRAMLPVVLRWRAEASHRVQTFYGAFRRAETGDLAALPFPPLLDSPERVTTSLAVTGPARIQYLTERGVEPADAAKLALRDVSRASSRHVLDGGRDTVVEMARSDARAIGWARLTDADPCGFCAMLASRGAVFPSKSVAERTTRRSKRGPGERYHDGCACVGVPVFDADAPLPGRGDEFAALWDEVTAGLSGNEARNAFRRAVEGPRRASGGATTGTRPRAGRPMVTAGARQRDRRREITAELATLEKTFTGLRRRKDAGESVDKPYAYQRDRIAQLRRELAQLHGG